MERSVLLLLEQSPFDPASGAARSMRTISEILARNGWRVRALATTNTEGAASVDPFEVLTRNGCADATGEPRGVIRATHRGVAHTLLDTRGAVFRGRMESGAEAFDRSEEHTSEHQSHSN